MDAPDPDEPQDAPTLAGRALRALRAPRVDDAAAAPATPEVEAEIEPESAPDFAPESAPLPEPVMLTKAPDDAPADAPAEATPTEPARVRSGRLVLVAAVLAVLALAYAVVGLAVHLAGRDTTSATASARDAVVTAARIDIATLYTLDYHNPQAGLARWRAVTTGGFEQQIAQSGSTVASAISKAKLSTSGQVVAAAVTDLDVDAGTATVIASMDVTKTPSTGSSATSRNRFRATMQRVDGVWKVADLSQVQVQLS